MKRTRPEWAEQVVYQMYQYGIYNGDLAEVTGYSKRYISMVLSGLNASKRAQVAIITAMEKLKQQKDT